MDNKELDSTKIQKVQISKPLKWIGYDSVETKHATNLIVQENGGEFILSFFEVYPPLITGNPEEQAAQVNQLPHIEAKCVARIVLSAQNAFLSSNVLLEQLGRFQAMIEQLGKEEENDD